MLDLLEKTGLTTKRVAATHGGEWAGPCPLCGGTDRFRVWPEQGDNGKWWCRQCGRGGDAIQFLRDVKGLGFREACSVLGQEPRTRRHGPRANPGAGTWTPRAAALPCQAWRERAGAFLSWAERNLAGNPDALRWLGQERGLRAETVKAARLGWNPKDLFLDRGAWGLEGDKRLWIPAGLVIPSFREKLFQEKIPADTIKKRAQRVQAKNGTNVPNTPTPEPESEKEENKEISPKGLTAETIRTRVRRQQAEDRSNDQCPPTPEPESEKEHIQDFKSHPGEGDPFRLKIRRPGGDEPRYVHVSGGSSQTWVLPGEAAGFAVVESELDGLLLWQEARDLCRVVILGSAQARPDEKAAARLRDADAVLLALDSDAAGAKESLWWMRHFPKARRWPPVRGKDITDMHKAAVPVRTWVEAGLNEGTPGGRSNLRGRKRGTDGYLSVNFNEGFL